MRCLQFGGLVFLVLCFLNACGRSDPMHFYLLDSVPNAVQVSNLPQKTLRIARLSIPQYLDRNGIVSKKDGEAQMQVADLHVWAEPLDYGLRRIVQDCLTVPLLEAGLTVLPLASEERSDYLLFVDVSRFEGDFAGQALLSAQWSLQNRNEKVLARGFFSASENITGQKYADLVEAESKLAKKMGKELAQKIGAIF